MVTRCIVSVFTQLKKAAVLFDSQKRSSFVRSLLVFSALSMPFMSNAQLTSKDWYGTSNCVIKSANDCNTVYSISYSAENNGQIELKKNGEFVNSHNTVLASNLPSSLKWHKNGGPNEADAIVSSVAQDVVIYFIKGVGKDTIAGEMPGYSQIGVNGIGYEQMNITSTPKFSAVYCGTGSPSASATYQWQVYDKKTDSWSNIDGATEETYTAPAASLPDSCSIRVVFNDGSEKLTSPAVIAYYGSPSIDFSIEGTEIFETVQKPRYENEIDFGSSFTVKVKTIGAGVFNSYTLQTRSDNDEVFKDYQTITAPDSSFTIKPESNLEYRLVAVGEDARPGREGDKVSVNESFFVRVRFSWDEGAEVDTLFFDNFGTFTADNEYEIYDGTKFVDTLTDIAGESNAIMKYWAPDYYNSVKNHKYSMLNPLVGPFSGDCAADGYKHFACWEDGACDGYRVEDGFYAILPNPDYSNCGRSTKDYWNGYDHTTESSTALGGMLFVNCNEGSQHTVLLERQITLDQDCENTRLLFSSYVNNATSVADNKPVNVRLIIRDQDSTIVFETPSGNIYPRSMKGGQWANLSFMFNAVKGGKYTLQLVNNQEGGALDAGNDLLFDDILILAAYPTVNVYRDRLKSSMVPIDTCQEVTIPLFVLNQHDIKKYITDPQYLYQYSKDTVNWVNIGDITRLDSFLITLTKEDPTFWDTTYFRGIVASNTDVIKNILLGNAPVLSCDSVYAISSPYRVVFDYSGPLDPTLVDTLCVGETFTAKVSAHKRSVYRFVDSYTKETIVNMDTTFSYTLKETDPADTLFYFVTEQRLGCTDTMSIKVHRRLFVNFDTPDNFVVCLYDSLAHLNNVVPSSAAFAWKSGEFAENTTEPKLKLPATLPQQGSFSVTGYAKDYCPTTKSFTYDIHNPITVSLAADRDDSLFCLSDPSATFGLTANTLTGVPVTYYWLMDDVQVGMTKAPVNEFSYGALSQGKHVFSVKVADEVCNITDSSEFDVNLPVEIREPITIALTADEAVCENANANARVQLANLLKPEGTDVKWTVSSGNAQLDATTTTDAQQASANVVKPVAVTNTTEQILISASVDDKVCKDNKPNATASIDMYKVLDAVVTTDRADSLFCMTNTGITFNVTTLRGYVKDFYWYADGSYLATTGHDVPTYTFPVVTEGSHVYGVQMTDDVCNKRDSNEFKFEVPIETRLPITISLTADDKICEDVNANAEVKLEHLLTPDGTQVFWAVGVNALLQSEYTSTVASESKNVVLPVSTTNTTEQITLAASVADKVCTDNVPSANVTINLYKKINASVMTDRTDGLFCMDGSTGITFTAVVDRGEVSNYIWFADGGQVDVTGPETPTYTFPVVTEGQHIYGVKMTDGVCNPLGGGEFEFQVPVETRLPITMELVAPENLCEDNMADVEVRLEHLLVEPTEVVWSVTENAKVYVATPTVEGVSKNVIMPSPTTNAKEVVIVTAAVNDLVCPQNNPVSKSASLNLHKLVMISLAADGLNGMKCFTSDTEKTNGLTVTVERGDPAYYIWSDGERTTLPTRDYTLALGNNEIIVEAYDSVCVSDAAAASAIVNVVTREPLIVSVAQTVGSNPICIGNEVEFTATVENNFPGDQLLYNWDPAYGDGVSVKFQPTSGTNGVAVYVLADNAICPASSASSSVYVQDSVVISIQAPESLCQSTDTTSEVELLVKVWSGDPIAFVWSTGDTTVTNKAYDNPTTDQVYWVYAIDEVCANSFKVYAENKTEVSNMFSIDVDALAYEVQMGTNAQLTGVIKENVTPVELAWNMRNDETLSELFLGNAWPGNFEVMMPDKGTYSFYAIADGKHCGFVYSDTVTIDVADYYQIPTAFTPYNSNPKNNVFMKGYSVEIFNRYQQMVYEGADGWDGQYNGKLADPGTYFYRLRKKDGRVIKGTIELVKF